MNRLLCRKHEKGSHSSSWLFTLLLFFFCFFFFSLYSLRSLRSKTHMSPFFSRYDLLY